ncbi:MAG TPA: hypothetical protein VGW38_03850, partial [Chloroflexota bacterium]|nr:hypothetical protein [Chloroflexota bacterium]
ERDMAHQHVIGDPGQLPAALTQAITGTLDPVFGRRTRAALEALAAHVADPTERERLLEEAQARVTQYAVDLALLAQAKWTDALDQFPPEDMPEADSAG